MRNMNEEIVNQQKSKKVNWDRLDVDIQHEGRAITLPGEPGKMPMEKAVEALNRKIADENQEFRFVEWIENGHPLDAAVAFVKAMTRLYGFASPQTEWAKTMFGTEKRPPTMLSIKTGHGVDDVVQCPMGIFALPGIAAPVQTRIVPNSAGKFCFVVTSDARKKNKHVLLELVTETRRILAAESIYKGKAIRFRVDIDGNVDMETPPEFMDVGDTSEADLIFDADIQDQIEDSILTPIKETADCRENNVPLKRGILLEGPYGTGKSLTARMVAAVCEQNGWTFVLLDRVQGLKNALEFCNQYGPAVAFAEDIDRIASTRDDDANDLINIIDGVVSKRSEVMTILTTNFAEKLNPVIIRPGRFDAVISLRAPSNEAVARLLRSYAGKLLPDDETVARTAVELSGQIPATIRECVERAKLGMIRRKAKTLSDHDLVVAARTMKNHLALLNRDQKTQTHAEKLAESLQAVVQGNKPTDEVGGNSRGVVINRLRRIEGNTEEILSRVN